MQNVRFFCSVSLRRLGYQCTEALLMSWLLLILTLAPAHAQTWNLVWSDEFNTTSLGVDWERMIGDGTAYGLPAGWGNNELQYYTDSPNNCFVSGGYLHIVVRQESVGGYNYTSARLRTKGKRDFKYGKIEARIKLPTSKGMWPAFWMLPTAEVYGSWAASGEIDIAEAQILTFPKQIIQAIHYGGVWPDNLNTTWYHSEGNGPNAVDFSKDFHLYAIEWEANQIRWYVDGVNTFSTSSWSSTGGPYPAPFDQLFHILLNVAVGGAAPTPGQGTVLPQEMLVDYVRVYQLQGGGTGTKTHVASVVTSTVAAGAGKKRGRATVTVQDEFGNPVGNATVTGNFSGTFNEIGRTGVTASDGKAIIDTVGTAGGSVTVNFCVSNISHATLTYDPAANAPGTTCP
jgi:beta-glucanase (GH16 family)